MFLIISEMLTVYLEKHSDFWGVLMSHFINKETKDV